MKTVLQMERVNFMITKACIATQTLVSSSYPSGYSRYYLYTMASVIQYINKVLYCAQYINRDVRRKHRYV